MQMTSREIQGVRENQRDIENEKDKGDSEKDIRT